MAIYAGNWLDGEGDPFMPSAVSRVTGNQGNVGQQHAPPDPDAPNRVAFGLAAQVSAKDYLGNLPEEEFQLLCDWDDFPGSTFRTDFPILHALQPWERFNCRLFLDYFGYPEPRATWPVPSQQYTVEFLLEEADSESYVAKIEVDYDVIGEPDPDNGIAVFHVDPAKINSSATYKFTRLSKIWEWSPGHPHHFDLLCPFMWPQPIGTTYQCLIRVKQRWFWMQSESHQIVVT